MKLGRDGIPAGGIGQGEARGRHDGIASRGVDQHKAATRRGALLHLFFFACVTPDGGLRVSAKGDASWLASWSSKARGKRAVSPANGKIILLLANSVEHAARPKGTSSDGWFGRSLEWQEIFISLFSGDSLSPTAFTS